MHQTLGIQKAKVWRTRKIYYKRSL